MKLTSEELRKVYQASYSEVRQIRNHLNVSTAAADIEAAHEAGLLAVARFVAERQRAVEPTEEMLLRGGLAVSDIYAKEGGWCGVEAAKDQVVATYRAMSAVAPLVVPE